LAQTTSNNDNSGLSTGAIVGIALGAFAAVLLLLGLIAYAISAARHRRARDETVDSAPDPFSSAMCTVFTTSAQ
jgi:hypothetical protein